MWRELVRRGAARLAYAAGELLIDLAMVVEPPRAAESKLDDDAVGGAPDDGPSTALGSFDEYELVGGDKERVVLPPADLPLKGAAPARVHPRRSVG